MTPIVSRPGDYKAFYVPEGRVVEFRLVRIPSNGVIYAHCPKKFIHFNAEVFRNMQRVSTKKGGG